MQELTDKQLYMALQFARSQDENAGRAIIEQFQKDQPALAHTLMSVFPTIIAGKDQNMAHLFMDLCFDALCVFQHAFGALPNQQNMNPTWLEKGAALLDAELQSLIRDQPMAAMMRNKLQNRFTERMIDSNSQKGLVNFMNMAIDDHVAEQHASPESVRMAKSMIFVVIQLFDAIYHHSSSKAA